MAGMDETGVTTIAGSEPDLPAGARRGFEDFFAEHHLRLFRAVWLLTRNRHEAEEVMQDAFLRTWERWDRVSAMPEPVGYLYRTAMNLFRSRRRRAAVALRRVVHQIPPDDELGLVDERASLVRTLAVLTPRQRAAVVLLDVLDFDSEQAGAILGIRPVTVRVLAGRGRDTLRRELGERDG
jgi:RNA polymerase sigma-70 factor (ECF subfamily)